MNTFEHSSLFFSKRARLGAMRLLLPWRHADTRSLRLYCICTGVSKTNTSKTKTEDRRPILLYIHTYPSLGITSRYGVISRKPFFLHKHDYAGCTWRKRDIRYGSQYKTLVMILYVFCQQKMYCLVNFGIKTTRRSHFRCCDIEPSSHSNKTHILAAALCPVTVTYGWKYIDRVMCFFLY